MKKQYRVQDTTTDNPNLYEVKSDGEARPRNDGTEPKRYQSLDAADAAAAEFAGMSVVDDYAGV